jgi:hypothetical protein
MSKFIIVYNGRKLDELAVAEISPGMEYEIGDYNLASQHDYKSEGQARHEAGILARKNGLKFARILD